MRDFFKLKNVYKKVNLGQLLILKVYIHLLIFICKCKNRSMITWDRTTIYTMWTF